MEIIMIQILHIVLSLDMGGLENGIINLVNGLDAKQFHIDVLCLNKRGTLSSNINNKNNAVYFDESFSENQTHRFSQYQFICSIRKHLASHHYHIIHTHGWATMLSTYLSCFFLNHKKPLIINGEHGTLYFKTKRQRWMQAFLFKQMALNLSVSNTLIKEISRRFNVPSSLFKALLNGVDTFKFNADQQKAETLKKKLMIDDKKQIIGSVGRLVPVKNYACLIKAFALLLKKHSAIHLIIAGDGSEMQSLKELVSYLAIEAHVSFLGQRHDIADLMKIYHIFVLPSFREGLSNTLLEAMASCLTVVASDVGGNSELVIHAKTGYLFESNNNQQLAHRLEQLIDDQKEREKIAFKAREHILQYYSLSCMIDNYKQTYLSLLMKKKG
jgi:glycosyltransferase involved in cell wall biosynthesis